MPQDGGAPPQPLSPPPPAAAPANEPARTTATRADPTHAKMGGKAKGRRVLLTVFSGGDGFAQAALRPGTGDRWSPVGGVEDKPDIAALWDEEAQGHGKVLGDYEAVCAQLERGDLLVPGGVIDAVVLTPPCQDYTTVNDAAAGEDGPTGKYMADLHRFVGLMKRRHRVKAYVLEEVVQVLPTEAFRKLVAVLRDANYQVAYGEAQFWLCGVPTTRTRLVLAALHTSYRKRPGPFRVPGLSEAGDAAVEVPQLGPILQAPEDVHPSLREDAGDLALFGSDHQQTALPAVQVGRMRGPGTNRYVYSVQAPALTLRANIRKAEGLGGVTGMYLDPLGPRRLSPVEVLRLHDFPETWASLPTATVYHIVGNSVPVQWARAVLNMLDQELKQ